LAHGHDKNKLLTSGTGNPIKPVRAECMLSEAVFERPIIDHKARQAQRDLSALQGQDGLWFCGAFVEEGIPLLEAGCRSGLLAAQQITGANAPWAIAKRIVYHAPSGGLSAWTQAARLPAHPMIGLPLLLGTLLHARQNGETDRVIAALLQVCGLLAQAFALFINDVADELTDSSNATFAHVSVRVSGGSRVIQENKLSADQLLVGSLYVLAALGVLIGSLTFYFALPMLPLLSFILLFGAYSYSMPPISFVFNGWGEYAQGALLGIFMPLTSFYCQSGSLAAPWSPLLAACALFTASNIVTGLPDEPSDQASGKYTLAVRRGGLVARIAAVSLTALSLYGPASTLVTVPLWCIVPVLALLAISVMFVPAADMSAQPARCGSFVLVLSIAHGWLMASWILALLLE
jgi:1,4-dihydroxy-2-naphthoate octaprenyltransferase